MASKVYWVVENQVMLIKYAGTIATDDVIQAMQIGTEWLQRTNNTVHVINDLTAVDNVAPSFQKVGDILNVTRTFMQMDNLGLTFAFGADNPMVKFLSNLVPQVSGINFRMFDTYAACREHLQHNVPDLVTLPTTIE